jgi:hypothetical protein
MYLKQIQNRIRKLEAVADLGGGRRIDVFFGLGMRAAPSRRGKCPLMIAMLDEIIHGPE